MAYIHRIMIFLQNLFLDLFVIWNVNLSIHVYDTGKVFEMLMGNEVAPRREFIVAGAAKLDKDSIDA